MKRIALAALAVLLAGNAYAQSIPAHFFSAASTNSTLVSNTTTLVYNIVAVNATAVVYYLKLYDKVSAPTCNTDAVVQTYPLPASATNPVALQIDFSQGLKFFNGLGFCITAAAADNDNTVAATGVTVNFAIKR